MEYTNKYASAVERIGQSYSEFDRIFVVMGNPTVSVANVFYRALPWEERKRYYSGNGQGNAAPDQCLAWSVSLSDYPSLPRSRFSRSDRSIL